MSWSMWGGAGGSGRHTPPLQSSNEKRSAWFHGRYKGPVWGLTVAMGASIYLRYFSGPAYDAKTTIAQFITMAIPIAIAIGSAAFAYSIFRGPRVRFDDDSSRRAP